MFTGLGGGSGRRAPAGTAGRWSEAGHRRREGAGGLAGWATRSRSSGACLTVVAIKREEFAVECMPETLSRTTLGSVEPGRRGQPGTLPDLG